MTKKEQSIELGGVDSQGACTGAPGLSDNPCPLSSAQGPLHEGNDAAAEPLESPSCACADALEASR